MKQREQRHLGCPDHSPAERGIPRHLSPRLFARLLYLASGIVLLATISLTAFNAVAVVSYERDIWHHIAVLNELIASPWHAKNPHIVSEAPSRSFTPWYVLLAMLARTFGLDAVEILGVSAVLTVAALITGVYIFARFYWKDEWAPLILIVVMFATWGVHFNHTGFHTLSTFVFSISYPFGIVLALGFISWWLVLRALRASYFSVSLALGLGAISAFMFATHQLQGAFAIGGMLTFAMFADQSSFARRMQIATAIIAGLLTSKAWWYFDAIQYVMLDEVHKGRLKLDSRDPLGILKLAGLAPLGILGFYNFRRRAFNYDLLFGSLGIFAALMVTWWLNIWVYLRLIPFQILFLQLALTGLLLWLMTRTGSSVILQRAGQIITGYVLMLMLALNILLAAAFYGKANAYLQGREVPNPPETWSKDIRRSMEKVKGWVGTGKVLIAHRQTAFPVEASHMKVVSIPKLFALVPDMVQRQIATEEFFAEETERNRRCEIMDQYSVAAILYRRQWLAASVQERLRAFGTEVHIHDLTLIVRGKGVDKDVCSPDDAS